MRGLPGAEGEKKKMMNSISLNDLAQIVMAVAAIFGGYWVLLKIVVGQFKSHLKDKFDAQDRAREEGRTELRTKLSEIEAHCRQLERDHLKLLADLPMNYVRREDHIRFDTVINAKLDALRSEMALMSERQLNKG